MFSWEKNFWEWVHRHLFAIGAAVFLAVSVVLRIGLAPFHSYDYTVCLEDWYLQLRDAGGVLAGMRKEIGDYNHLYRFLLSLMTRIDNPVWAIKLPSLAFDYIGAAAGGGLVYTVRRRQCCGKRRAAAEGVAAGLALLYLPVVLLNAAVWGQCDFMYTSFLVLCAVFLMRERYVPAFLCYGMAFSFKLQAIFLLPVLVLLYILTKKFSFTHFLLIPATVLVTGLPGIIARWPVTGAKALVEPFMIYTDQIDGYHSLTLNFPNIYSFLDPSALPEGRVNDLFRYARFAGTLFALAVLAAALWLVLLRRPAMTDRLLLLLCIFCVDTCTLFLPTMHERYAFCGTIFLVLYCLLYRRLGTALFIRTVVEGCVYIYVLNENPVRFSYPALAVANLAAYAMLVREIYLLLHSEQNPINDEREEQKTESEEYVCV